MCLRPLPCGTLTPAQHYLQANLNLHFGRRWSPLQRYALFKLSYWFKFSLEMRDGLVRSYFADWNQLHTSEEELDHIKNSILPEPTAKLADLEIEITRIQEIYSSLTEQRQVLFNTNRGISELDLTGAPRVDFQSTYSRRSSSIPYPQFITHWWIHNTVPYFLLRYVMDGVG